MRRKILPVLIMAVLVLQATASGAIAQASNEPAVQPAVARALFFLKDMQNPDGGFPYEPGGPSSPAATDWVVIALGAAGEDPASGSWSPGGISPLEYMSDQQSQMESTCDMARSLLAWQGISRQARTQELVSIVKGFQQPDGQFGQPSLGEQGYINAHLWSVLALLSAGSEIPAPERARSWLLEQQNEDGGFGWATGIESDADDTAAAIEVLRALGEPSSSASIQKALSYLRSCQGSDGGFNAGWMGAPSNASTDSWVIQALLASGNDPRGAQWVVNGQDPWKHLLSLQNEDGGFNWTSNQEGTSVTCTAAALLALLHKPFPFSGDRALFRDVPSDHWAYPSVLAMHQNGVVSGFQDGLFRPDEPVTRAQFSVMLMKSMGNNGRDADPGDFGFRDLTPEHWAYESVQSAAAVGYFTGRPGQVFDPDAPITGGEIAVILCRVVDARTEDVSGTEWYGPYVAALKNYDILYPQFDADAYASRAQCCFSLSVLLDRRP